MRSWSRRWGQPEDARAPGLYTCLNGRVGLTSQAFIPEHSRTLKHGGGQPEAHRRFISFPILLHFCVGHCQRVRWPTLACANPPGRRAMPSIHAILDTVVASLGRARGADVDVNNAALRYAMDVTGAVCFGTAFGTAAAFDDARTNDLFAVLRGGVTHVECGL